MQYNTQRNTSRLNQRHVLLISTLVLWKINLEYDITMIPHTHTVTHTHTQTDTQSDGEQWVTTHPAISLLVSG